MWKPFMIGEGENHENKPVEIFHYIVIPTITTSIKTGERGSHKDSLILFQCNPL
jgi:hypothetical protein